ncbi:MAG: insulinase family protein, partial [Desulfobacteraceae bacterium]|nr:insulinase family protein [Desulfobacteraceae bacterium]
MIKRIPVRQFCILLLLLSFSLIWASCAPKNPVIRFSQGLESDPALVHGTLTNGFQYVLLENKLPEDRVYMNLSIFAGSMNETEEQSGIAHFLEHMLFNGSTHFQPGELIEYFQSIGMDFGADANAHTTFYNTVYDLSLPKGDEKYLADALVVIEDYAKGALLLEREIDRERGIVLAEKRERDSVGFRTFEATLKFELPGSLLAQRFPIGTEDVLKKADQKILKDFYNTWYRPDNMVLIMVGDFDAALAQSLIKKRFVSFQSQTLASNLPSDDKWLPHKGIKAFYHYEPEAGNSDVTIETLEWTPFKTQTEAEMKKHLLRSIGDEILENRLSRMITKQQVDFSESSVFSGKYLRHLSLTGISATAGPDTWDESLEQLARSLNQALTHGFAQQEFDRVKANIVTSLENVVKQAPTRKSDALSNMILSKVNNKGVILSPLQRRDILVPYLESISLTDVNDAFKKTWDRDHRLILVTGNAIIKPEKGERPEDKIIDVFNQGTTGLVEKYRASETKGFPYLKIPKRTVQIKNRKDDIEGLGISQVDFDNNVRLNLKKNDYKKGQFVFKLVFGDGKKSEPKELPGLSIISESTVRLSGFKGIDADQLEVALAGKDVSIRFSVKEDYFTLSGSADASELELVFQLLYTYLMEPGFRQEGLSLAKKRYDQFFQGLKRTPEGLMEIKGDAFLAGYDPRFGIPDPQKTDRITLTDVENWLKPYFRSSKIEISVAGDVDPEKVIQQAKRYLGSLQKRAEFQQKRKNDDQPSFPKGEKLDLALDTKIDKGLVLLAFLTDDFWDINQ